MEHSKRIGRLAKSDLHHICRSQNGIQSHKEHREWFRFKEEKAIDNVKAWVNWLDKQKSYYRNNNLKAIWSYFIKKDRMLPRGILWTMITKLGGTLRIMSFAAVWKWYQTLPNSLSHNGPDGLAKGLSGTCIPCVQ